MKVARLARVGLLPGLFWFSRGDLPVMFVMKSEMADLATLYVEKFRTRTVVTVANGGRAPDDVN